MARVIGVHELEPKPGVTEVQLEQAIRAFVAQPQPSGWRQSLIKGDRSARAGKYGILTEVESVEARDRIFSSDGATEAYNQHVANHPEIEPTWEHLMSLVVQPWNWTDYVVG